MDKKVVQFDPEAFYEGCEKMLYKALFFSKESCDNVDCPTEDKYKDTEEFIVALYKDRGMENSKQLVYGTPAGVLTAIVSVLNTFIEKGIIEDEVLKKDIEKIFKDLTEV